MRPGLIVTGVLGTGTALVFAAALLASALFPNGGEVAAGWNGGDWAKPMPVPMPVEVPADGGGMVDDSKDEAPPPDVAPGDVASPDAGG